MLAAKAAGEVLVDGAILGTPNATHVPLGIQLVKGGVHVLVEKVVSMQVFAFALIVVNFADLFLAYVY